MHIQFVPKLHGLGHLFNILSQALGFQWYIKLLILSIYLVVCEKQIKNEVKVIEMSCKVKCLPDIGSIYTSRYF